MPETLSECGFEIHRDGAEVLLLNRRTWWLGYGMGMLALAAMVFAVVGLLGLAGTTELRSGVPALALLVGAAVLGSVSVALLPMYKRRRRLPSSEIADGAVIDGAAGVLRERSGAVLARLDAVTAAVRIDWMTRGWMRLVVLSWPGGRRTVYRTGSRQRARRVAESLNDALGR